MCNERLPFLIKFMEEQIEELEAERIPGLAARGDVEMSAHREILDVLTSLSAGVPPPAAETPNKLLWLATESAESFHDYYISYGFPHPCTEKLLDAAAHFGDFGVCLHPDCVLVRAVPPPADETWQPIETAPKDGPLLAIRRGVWTIPMILIWLDGPGLGEPAWRQFDGDSQRSFTPTHWMPLPSEPAKETP